MRSMEQNRVMWDIEKNEMFSQVIHRKNLENVKISLLRTLKQTKVGSIQVRTFFGAI